MIQGCPYLLNIVLWFFFLSFLWAILEFEFRALGLWGRYSTAWTMPTIFFVLGILEIGPCFLPGLASTMILLFEVSCCHCEDRHIPPLKWVLQMFFPVWPGNSILLISAFCISLDNRHTS
jgi:hypothetical protein